ncbi:hypothetical protein ACMDCR_06340 [Labrys okinawensis]|uniref:hypothetical protein n=1 Tax=Labrys okinawensis TaxID=346911 RepID=UPI0039BCC009
MKPMLDISAQPTATRLLVHAVVLLATLVLSALICFGLFDPPFPMVVLQWVGFITLGKLLYFVIAYPLLGGSFVDPLEEMFENARRK